MGLQQLGGYACLYHQMKSEFFYTQQTTSIMNLDSQYQSCEEVDACHTFKLCSSTITKLTIESFILNKPPIFTDTKL